MKLTFNKKKCFCITGIVLGCIVILTALILIFFSVIAKGAVQNVGPLITGVPMKVNAVLFNAFTGQFSIKGLVIGNPEGYSSEYALKLDNFHIDVDMSSVFAKKLVIEKIRINGVELNYETSLLNNNLTQIQKNVERLSGPGKEKNKEKNSSQTAAKPLQINLIELKDITAWVIVKGTVVQTPIPVLPVTLHDLGSSPEGISSAMVINDVLLSLLGSIANTAGIDKAASAIADGTGKAVKSVGDAARNTLNFFSKQVKKTEKR